MVLQSIIVYIMSQLLKLGDKQSNSDSAGSSGTADPNNPANPENVTILYEISFQKIKEMFDQAAKGLYSMIKEMWNLVRRSDKHYAESKKYKHIANVRHEGKVAVITGGDEDIGAQTAADLAQSGFKVIIGAKYPTTKENQSKQIRTLRVDMTSFKSIGEFAAQVAALEPKIDVLINAADHYEKQYILTRNGIEKNLAHNYLGHFYLTILLLDNLKKSENGRIINVSSIDQYLGGIDFKDINSTKYFIPYFAYAQSKLAQVLFTRELSKRLIDTNVTVYAVSPEIIRNLKSPQRSIWSQVLAMLSNPINGSQTLLYVSLEDSLKNESGFYYTNLERVEHLLCNANDDQVAERLWEVSEDMVKLDPDHRLKPIRKEANPSKP